MEKKKYPIGPEHYVLYEEIGQGVSAIVHRALCISFYEIVAIKIFDFERDNCDLNNISREAQTMVLVNHPNILKSHCSFVSDHNLWVVMPFMSGGSCLYIMKMAHPDGFEENVIATILREVLKGLEYLHLHGHIHRDVKAGNILIDAHTGIKLGDLGVSVCLFDSGDRQCTRNSLVGTPYWMAPEVMEQKQGYDFKADIWSFGITALELAHGHAPFSKYPPVKVLSMTLNHAPPCLDSKKDKKFSKSFKQMVGCCLVKDPSKRPSAKKLLKHSFFKQARSNDFIERTLLEGLPALGDCMEALKRKEDMCEEKIHNGKMEEPSQSSHKRGISSWNFNLEDIKAQASLIQDFDDTTSNMSQIRSSCSLSTLDSQEMQLSSPNKNSSQIANMENNDGMQKQQTFIPINNSKVNDTKFKEYEDDSNIIYSSCKYDNPQTSTSHVYNYVKDKLDEKPEDENDGRIVEDMPLHSYQKRECSSSILPEITLPLIREDSEKLKNQQNISNYNAHIVPHKGEDVLVELPSKATKSSVKSHDIDEKVKVLGVQQRGHFKVMPKNVDVEKVIVQHNLAYLPSPLPTSLASNVTSSSNLSGSSLFIVLHSVLQTNILERESILTLMKQITIDDFTAGGTCIPTQIASIEKSLLEAAQNREKELLNELTELQWRHIYSEEGLQ